MEQKDTLELDRPDNHLLNSWKEIAYYLGVHVRTAQKWKKERGLPIRQGSGKHGRVSADTTALQSWKQKDAPAVDEHRYYRCPLGLNVVVEIRFSGGRNLSRTH